VFFEVGKGLGKSVEMISKENLVALQKVKLHFSSAELSLEIWDF